MTPCPQSKAVSARRAARVRSRVVFFLLRRSLRRLQRGVNARLTLRGLSTPGPRPLRLEKYS
jgi:hypothetical protein